MVTTAQIIQPNMECFYQIYLKCVVYDNVCDLRDTRSASNILQPDLITTRKVKCILSGSDTVRCWCLIELQENTHGVCTLLLLVLWLLRPCCPSIACCCRCSPGNHTAESGHLHNNKLAPNLLLFTSTCRSRGVTIQVRPSAVLPKLSRYALAAVNYGPV